MSCVLTTMDVIQFLTKFFQDRFNIRLSDRIDEETLNGLIKQMTAQVATLSLSPEDANMRVLSMVKDQLKARLITQHQVSPVSPVSPVIPRPVPVPALPGGSTDDGSVTVAAANDGEFFAAVKRYEEERARNRNINLAAPATVVTAATAATVVASVASVAASATGHFVINGHERNWLFSPPRNLIVWPGPLPKSSLELRLDSVQLPRSVSALTPHVVMDIQGAGGQTVRFVLLPAYGFASEGWLSYQPIHGNMKPLSCPWTIKLFDAYGDPLALGEDTARVVHERDAWLSLRPASAISPGDRLIIQPPSSDPVRVTVAGVSRSAEPNTVLVDVHGAAGSHAGAHVLNLARQVSLIWSTCLT